MDNDIRTHLFNIHFHGWSMHEAHTVAERLKLLHLESAANPLLSRIIVAGDMNLRFSDKPVLDVSTSKAMFKEPKHSKVAKVLLSSLVKITRIEHDQFTYFNNSLQHLNDIDHNFLSAPGWFQTQWRFEVEVQKPEDLYSRGISDHGALLCRFKSSKLPNSNFFLKN